MRSLYGAAPRLTCAVATATSLLIGSGTVVATPPGAGEDDRQAAAAPPGLACVQNALGGTRAFAAVKTLRIFGSSKPSASSGPRPLAGTREISVVFPDRYKRVDFGKPRPSSAGLGSTIGFSGPVLLSEPRVPDSKAAMRSAREDFVRQMLMRLPHALPGVTLSQQTITDGTQERLALNASDAGGVIATLLVNPKTCVPAAMHYAFRRGQRVRFELSAYREFGGVRFPTALRWLSGGAPFSEEQVTNVVVNGTDAANYFDR